MFACSHENIVANSCSQFTFHYAAASCSFFRKSIFSRTTHVSATARPDCLPRRHRACAVPSPWSLLRSFDRAETLILGYAPNCSTMPRPLRRRGCVRLWESPSAITQPSQPRALSNARPVCSPFPAADRAPSTAPRSASTLQRPIRLQSRHPLPKAPVPPNQQRSVHAPLSICPGRLTYVWVPRINSPFGASPYADPECRTEWGARPRCRNGTRRSHGTRLRPPDRSSSVRLEPWRLRAIPPSPSPARR